MKQQWVSILAHGWTALGGASLAVATYLLAETTPQIGVVIGCFFTTFIYYQLLSQKIFDSKKWNWFSVVFIALAALAFELIVDVADQPKLLLPILGITAAMLIVFSYPVKRIFGKPLRNIPYLKVFLIAYCWTIVTALIPMWFMGEWNMYMLASRFAFILALCLACDVVDVKEDEGVINTFATKYGISATKFLCTGCLIFSLLILKNFAEFSSVIYATVAALVLLIVVKPGDKTRQNILLDGAMVLYAVFIYLF